MYYRYHPLQRACKSHPGAFPRESAVTFRIYQKAGGEADFSADFCHFVLVKEGRQPMLFPMKKTDEGFTVTLRFRETGLYFYHFSFPNGTCLGCGPFREGVVTRQPQDWQITVYDETYETPDWFKGGVMYQIFPDRFARAGTNPIAPDKIFRLDWGGIPEYRPNEFGKVVNNDFFGGNINGIRSKLGYLASLGVGTVYLNPIFEAFSNHRYDTGDYFKIDALFGTVEEFDALVREAEALGIRIVLDGVFNHTGDDSRYFNKYGRYKEELGAHQSPDSPYADWYTFREFPDSYDAWWGIETLPAVNESSPSYQEFILGENGVVRTWLRHGIAGYRIDVADELPDFFLKEMRDAIKTEREDAIIIGEVWEDASNKISYDERRAYLQGDELDSVMNYPLKDAIINYALTGNTALLRETIAMLLDNYPKATLDCLMNILGTHDTPRILTVLGGRECRTKDDMANTSLTADERKRALRRLRHAALLQFTLPGVPCVYYGDEIGMEGYLDPFCRRCFDWNATDGEPSAFYRKLGEIRTKKFRDVFADGEYRELYADAACLVFERRKGDRSVVVFVNNSACEYRVTFDGSFEEQLSGETYRGAFTIGQDACGILAKTE